MATGILQEKLFYHKRCRKSIPMHLVKLENGPYWLSFGNIFILCVSRNTAILLRSVIPPVLFKRIKKEPKQPKNTKLQTKPKINTKKTQHLLQKKAKNNPKQNKKTSNQPIKAKQKNPIIF